MLQKVNLIILHFSHVKLIALKFAAKNKTNIWPLSTGEIYGFKVCCKDHNQFLFNFQEIKLLALRFAEKVKLIILHFSQVKLLALKFAAKY